jgi:hypothetical protein
MASYSQNGDFERLVEQITDVIVARLNGDGAGEDEGVRVRERVL